MLHLVVNRYLSNDAKSVGWARLVCKQWAASITRPPRGSLRVCIGCGDDESTCKLLHGDDAFDKQIGCCANHDWCVADDIKGTLQTKARETGYKDLPVSRATLGKLPLLCESCAEDMWSDHYGDETCDECLDSSDSYDWDW